MDQGGCTPPVFVGSVGEKDLGHNFFSDSAVEQTAHFARDRILLSLIGEWEDIRRKKHRRSRLRVARGLRETVVEVASPGSCHVPQNAIERDSSIFVSVESLIEEVAQEAPVLRDAFAVNARDRGYRIRRMLDVRGEITDGRES